MSQIGLLGPSKAGPWGSDLTSVSRLAGRAQAGTSVHTTKDGTCQNTGGEEEANRDLDE